MLRGFLKCLFVSSLILTQATAYGAPPPPPPPFPDQCAGKGKRGEKRPLHEEAAEQLHAPESPDERYLTDAREYRELTRMLARLRGMMPPPQPTTFQEQISMYTQKITAEQMCIESIMSFIVQVRQTISTHTLGNWASYQARAQYAQGALAALRNSWQLSEVEVTSKRAHAILRHEHAPMYPGAMAAQQIEELEHTDICKAVQIVDLWRQLCELVANLQQLDIAAVAHEQPPVLHGALAAATAQPLLQLEPSAPRGLPDGRLFKPAQK